MVFHQFLAPSQERPFNSQPHAKLAYFTDTFQLNSSFQLTVSYEADRLTCPFSLIFIIFQFTVSREADLDTVFANSDYIFCSIHSLSRSWPHSIHTIHVVVTLSTRSLIRGWHNGIVSYRCRMGLSTHSLSRGWHKPYHTELWCVHFQLTASREADV